MKASIKFPDSAPTPPSLTWEYVSQNEGVYILASDIPEGINDSRFVTLTSSDDKKVTLFLSFNGNINIAAGRMWTTDLFVEMNESLEILIKKNG